MDDCCLYPGENQRIQRDPTLTYTESNLRNSTTNRQSFKHYLYLTIAIVAFKHLKHLFHCCLILTCSDLICDLIYPCLCVASTGGITCPGCIMENSLAWHQEFCRLNHFLQASALKAPTRYGSSIYLSLLRGHEDVVGTRGLYLDRYVQ